jgi:hypothetical protein
VLCCCISACYFLAYSWELSAIFRNLKREGKREREVIAVTWATRKTKSLCTLKFLLYISSANRWTALMKCFSFSLGGATMSPLGTSANIWGRWWVMIVEQQVEWLTGERKVLKEKPTPVSLCPPQIPHDPIRIRTRAVAVGLQRPTAWADTSLCLRDGWLLLSWRTSVAVCGVFVETSVSCARCLGDFRRKYAGLAPT